MNKTIKILTILFVIVLACSQVFALGDGDWDNVTPGEGVGTVNTTVRNIWATVIRVVQALAIAATVFAGLRYMFASADSKADIKKSMGILAVGAILVFAATTAISFVVDIAKEALS